VSCSNATSTDATAGGNSVGLSLHADILASATSACVRARFKDAGAHQWAPGWCREPWGVSFS
jgi:hypothetical protein